jgi:hypothetical protein
VGVAPRLLVTGGAEPELRVFLNTPHELVPDLVLRGLAELAGTPAV